jgi:sulfur-oxidizing protein SoxX
LDNVALLLAAAVLCAAAGEPVRAAGEPGRGRAIVTNREVGLCVLCHSGPWPEVTFQGSIGPNLAGIGKRLSEDEIRSRVAHARALNPDSVMPNYDGSGARQRVAAAFQGKPILTAQQIDDVVAYLATLRTP